MRDRSLRDCRRTVMRTAAAIRLLREDRATADATVYRSVFSSSVYVGRGLDRLARSVDRALRRGWKTAGEARERGGPGRAGRDGGMVHLRRRPVLSSGSPAGVGRRALGGGRDVNTFPCRDCGERDAGLPCRLSGVSRLQSQTGSAAGRLQKRTAGL